MHEKNKTHQSSPTSSKKRSMASAGAPPETFMLFLLFIPLIVGTIYHNHKHNIEHFFQQAMQKTLIILQVLALGLSIAALVFILYYFILRYRQSHLLNSNSPLPPFSFGKAQTVLAPRSENLISKIHHFAFPPLYLQNCNHFKINDTIQKYHQLVLGASGSGKTYSVLQPQVRHDIEAGKAIFIIDPKGDTQFSDAVYTYCKMAGRADDFRYFSISSPEQSHAFNPFGTSSINECKDLIIAATNWSEPYYKKMAEVALMQALQELPTKKRYLSEIIPLIPTKAKEFSGLRSDLSLMKISDYGPLIDGEGLPTLLDFYHENKVCFFSLNTQAYPEASVQLGKILLGGIMGISNYVQTKLDSALESRRPVSVIVDEFGSFLNEPFINFLNKARSANFRIILATQSVGDLEKFGDQTRKQIADNTLVKIVLAMSDPDSVEYASRLFGTQKSTKMTKQVDERRLFSGRTTGTGSEREVQEFVIHPSEIRQLERGEGFIMTQNPFSISKVKFLPKKINSLKYAEAKGKTEEEKEEKKESEAFLCCEREGNVKSKDELMFIEY